MDDVEELFGGFVQVIEFELEALEAVLRVYSITNLSNCRELAG